MNFESKLAEQKAKQMINKYGNFTIWEKTITLAMLDTFEENILDRRKNYNANIQLQFSDQLAERTYKQLTKIYGNNLIGCANKNYKYTLQEILQLEEFLYKNRR